MDAVVTQPASTYERHDPEHDLLYQVLAEHLETFLQQARTADHALPAYVEDDLRAYLQCGVLACGFVRLRCPDCKQSRIVAFSCRRRGFCPSCLGRRMAETAARLVDQVLPQVPIRQWVLSFPIEIRYRLAYDGELLSEVLRTFREHLNAFYRDQARHRGHLDGRTGGITFVQRAGSSLNLNPHLHVLMLDGVYVTDVLTGKPTFVAVDPPTDEQVQRLVEQAAVRLIAVLERRGMLDDSHTDPLRDQAPVLAGITAASIQGTIATGERAGRRVRRVLADPAEGIRTAPLCFAARGFSLHAATTVQAHDPAGRERLCRYVSRPPLAYGRLQRLDTERLSFTLKTAWDDGTYQIVVSPHELIEKLAALVPPPRLHLIRYHGVLAPNAADRALIVPTPTATDGPAEKVTEATPASRLQRLSWAALLARVFQVDAMVCPDCGGRMRWVAVLTDQHSIRDYLTGVGLPAEPPVIAPARPPPQQEMEFFA